MVTHRLWKRARTRPLRAICKRRLADVKTFTCGLTIVSHAGKSWTEARPRIGAGRLLFRQQCGDVCAICERSDDCVHSIAMCMQVLSALRPIHVIASAAKQSIVRQVETWIASLRSQ